MDNKKDTPIELGRRRKFRILFLLVLLALFTAQHVTAQSTRVYVGLGAMYHSFQDARFSDVRFTGTAIIPELGFRYLTEKTYILAQGFGFFHAVDLPGREEDKVTSLGFNTGLGYLRGITPGLYAGATWDVVDYMTRNTDVINNNSNFFHTASDLLLSIRYRYELNDAWSMEVGGDLGIVSVVKYAPSFAANLPQNIVDEGKASFQDEGVRQPFTLQYLDVKPGWSQLYLKTRAELYFKRRLSMAYLWRMRTFSDHKDHPVTMANHNLTLRYHFVSRSN